MNILFHQPSNKLIPSRWDLFAFVIISSILLAICWGGSHFLGHFSINTQATISLDPKALPEYALETVLRMFIALILSFIFTFVIGTLAAKNEKAEKIIIPLIDILQSVPILGYLSILVIFFIAIFPNSILGPQCAVIFAIFTSQVWNMTLSFYQSLKTIPIELKEAAAIYHLNLWQTFWKLDVPFAMPGLLWNAMMSMSGGWFFVVASEAISVGYNEIMLPGVGSYIQQAINMSDTKAMGYAILTMLIVIILYDQLLFRPLIKWSEKFNISDIPLTNTSSSWFLNLLKRSNWIQSVSHYLSYKFDDLVNISYFKTEQKINKYNGINAKVRQRVINLIWHISIVLITCVLITCVFIYLSWDLIYKNNNIGFTETMHVCVLGIYTGIRVFVLIFICSIIWVPIGVWIGLRSQIAQTIQPLAQILAAFPANLFFPIFIILIIKFDLNVEIWCAPLMVLGTQWYILFNVIAGASAIPEEVKFAAENMQLSGITKWFKYLLPAIFPFYVTGAITAAGGAWNASIVAEVMIWGEHKLKASGLGFYIAENTSQGNFPNIALGVLVMCFLVVLCNHILWRRLYRYAHSRFSY